MNRKEFNRVIEMLLYFYPKELKTYKDLELQVKFDKYIYELIGMVDRNES